MTRQKSDLLGAWRQVSPPEPVTVYFKEDGTLTYVIHREDSDQIIYLVYEANEGVIVSDQPSHPGTTRTSYHISSDGLLTLNYDGDITTFVRTDDREIVPEH